MVSTQLETMAGPFRESDQCLIVRAPDVADGEAFKKGIAGVENVVSEAESVRGPELTANILYP